MIDKARTIRNTNEMIFYLDSTHSDTFGNQEITDCDARYQTTDYHSLVALDVLTVDFLEAELRPEKVYTSKVVAAFTRQLFDHYQSVTTVRTIVVRADSGLQRQICMNFADTLFYQ
ncbi:transposase [Desemzia sp. FAM 23990]|uniref:transposase n=1 Tax=Desemzia sp. FAM 23990 TaxID=3259520 RepID=UPI003889E28D